MIRTEYPPQKPQPASRLRASGSPVTDEVVPVPMTGLSAAELRRIVIDIIG